MTDNKNTSSSGSDRDIVEAIRNIVRTDQFIGYGGKGFSFSGTDNIYAGWVEHINKDVGNENISVNVQEYIIGTDEFHEKQPLGLHCNVRISALASNHKGLLTVPKLKSDVVVAIDPTTKEEYVILFSDVDLVQIDSHDQIVIKSVEREEYKDEEGEPDVNELAETGNKAITTYSPTQISTNIESTGGNTRLRKIADCEQASASVIGANNDVLSTVWVNSKGVAVQHKKNAEINLDDRTSSVRYKDTQVVVKENEIDLGTETSKNLDYAVLGQELIKTLLNILQSIKTITVTTQLGPQPIINAADFVKIEALLNQYNSQVSGFLTPIVKIQKSSNTK